MSRTLHEWGPTGPGRLLTGSPDWRFCLSGNKFMFAVGDNKPIKGHVTDISIVLVNPGVIWASCLFFLVGRGRNAINVDGIPNALASELLSAVEAITKSEVAAFLAGGTAAHRAWAAQLQHALDIPKLEWMTDEHIANALKACPQPKLRDGATLEHLFEHPQLKAEVKRMGISTHDLKSPRATTDGIRDRHNSALFSGLLENWKHECSSAFSIGAKWVPASKAGQISAAFPAPTWPGRIWSEAIGVKDELTPANTVVRMRNAGNQQYLDLARITLKDFFDTVEKNPLTEEQTHAVVCFDDNVLIVAAAGSGKTSTMVAKTGYAIRQGLARPDQILLLAFNSDAAKELDSRINERLKGATDIDKVTSKTFHSFGKQVIAKATGEMPTLAPWLEQPGGDIRQVVNIIETLCDEDAGFRSSWEMFRVVFSQDIGKWDVPDEPEDWDSGTGRRGFRTAQGEVVKSKEERTIANWLFFCGVNYKYERAYEHKTADEIHRQYFPDFYFPDIAVYYEHFALDANGKAPPHFSPRYVPDAEWKRELHATHGTELIETTSHELREGKALTKLERELKARGLKLKFDSSRLAQGRPPVEGSQLAGSFRTFQQHVKGNGLSHDDLLAAIKLQSKEGYEARLKMYLDIYERIAGEWERRLKAGGYIDFDDMLNQAAQLLEDGEFDSPYSIVLADEFQDSSRARIRMLKGLTESHAGPVHLCVVGDDWQGINRFAGADISVMTEFDNVFENATRLMLTTTFRCPQDLCDISSAFIGKNPAQIAKAVTTTNPASDPSVFAYTTRDKDALPGLVGEHLQTISDNLKANTSDHHRASVMLLGRYRNDVPHQLGEWAARYRQHMDIEFRTVHSSKGLEADVVLVLNVVEGMRGFPCKIEDDPALQLAMPSPDPFPFAEERRLFYVAMTRARQEVRLYSTSAQPSQFLVELKKAGLIEITSTDGADAEPCPTCGKGMLLLRNGRNGQFFGCNQFPTCNYTKNVYQATRDNALKCPICETGNLVPKRGKYGMFLSCENWPSCNGKAKLH